MNEKVITIPASPVATIYRVSFSVRCNKGHEWGVALLPNYQLPLGWDTCLKCLQEQRKASRDE